MHVHIVVCRSVRKCTLKFRRCELFIRLMNKDSASTSAHDGRRPSQLFEIQEAQDTSGSLTYNHVDHP